MMRQLLWKDGMTIKPLLIAILLGIFGLNALMMLASAIVTTTPAHLFVGVWILMPNLVALGAPALLIGTEEESGTLNWLRTLPVSWQRVVDSKFLVAVVAVLMTWIVSSVVLFVMMSAFVPNGFRHNELLSFHGVLQLSFFTVLLLLVGFSSSYLFRSPVSALVAVIPSIVLLNAISVEVGAWIVTGSFRYRHALFIPSPGKLALLIGCGLSLLLVLFVVQRLLGRRRLTKTQGRSLRGWIPRSDNAYRPPARIGTERPSELSALLWQQCRQLMWPRLALTALAAMSIIIFYTEQSSERRTGLFAAIAEFSPLVIGLTANWLGAMVFYGDNVRRRCDFFADRGISPHRVWWTRLVPQLACILFLMLLSVTMANVWNVRESIWIMPAVIMTGFGFGQLVGQWVPRPTLAFFGAPTYSVFCCLILFWWFSMYGTYGWTIVLTVPILLLATWHLMSRWLDGQIGVAFHSRVIAYTCLATLLPIAIVLAHRAWTTPDLMPAWRSQTMAKRLPEPESPSPRINLFIANRASADPRPELIVGPDKMREHTALLKELLQQDTAFEAVDVYACDETIPTQMRVIAEEDVLELRLTSIALLLKWATTIREDIANGDELFWPAIRSALHAEQRAVAALEDLTNEYGTKPEFADLVAAIPSQDLRDRCQRNGLIREWRAYQRRPWRPEPGQNIWRGKLFLSMPVAYTVDWDPIERKRADRYIDLFTRRVLEQIDSGVPPQNSREHIETQRLLAEARRPPQDWRQHYTNIDFHGGSSLAIKRLQDRYDGKPKRQ